MAANHFRDVAFAITVDPSVPIAGFVLERAMKGKLTPSR